MKGAVRMLMYVNCHGNEQEIEEQIEFYRQHIEDAVVAHLMKDLPTRIDMLVKIVEAYAQGREKVRALLEDPSVNLEILLEIINQEYL